MTLAFDLDLDNNLFFQPRAFPVDPQSDFLCLNTNGYTVTNMGSNTSNNRPERTATVFYFINENLL
jgi:hypothetical protein